MKKTIQERIFEAMQKYNGEIAVETDNKNFTFDEIDRDSGSIARWISDNAIQKETFIGIYCHSRINLIRSIIGILKAGCVFVPLDPSYPLPRLESSVQTTQLKWIFCDQPQNNALGNNKILQNLGVQWVPLEEALKTAQSSINPVEYTPEDKIYIYFTSGSTGLPKAIVGKNAGLRHFIDWEIDTFSIPPRFRVSQLTAPGFDAFLRDLLVPLCSGGTLCIPPTQDGQLDAGLLSRWIHDQHLDLVHCVPSIFRLFNSDLNPSLYPSLKYVLLSGERVHPSDLAEWYKNFDDRIEVVNLYGPTETTMIKTFYRVKPADLTRERIPIGEPMKGSRVIILNDDMKVCDELMAGEIYIRTPYRTYGYFNDEAMNRVKFIPNPLNNDPADLVFKTGDIGR